MVFSFLPTEEVERLRVITVRFWGWDQFGFPASDDVTLTSYGGLPQKATRQGTKKCYAGWHDVKLIKAPGLLDALGRYGIAGDKYTIGIGRSVGDEADTPPNPENSIRFPLPVRVRTASQVRYFQDMLRGQFYRSGISPASMEIDVPNQAVEIVFADDEDVLSVGLVDPMTSSTQIRNV